MIDTLYVNGCSWTAGNELETDSALVKLIYENGLHFRRPDNPIELELLDANDVPAGYANDYFDNFNWAGRLKEQLKIKNLINDSLGGGSNSRILRTTIDFILSLTKEQQQSTLVVIGWTDTGRDEILFQNTWQYFNVTQPFSTTVNRHQITDEDTIKKVDKFQEEYIVNVYNDRVGVQKYFQGIYLLSNLLENLGIRYYFFSALPQWWTAGDLKLNHNVEDELPEYVQWYENHRFIHPMRDNMFVFINSTNVQLLRGKYGHPLSEGHKAWADYLLPFIKEIL